MQMHNFFPPCPPGGNSGRGCFLLPQEESRFLQLLVQKRIWGGGLTALEPQWFSFRQTLPSWEGDQLTPLCWLLPCSFVSWSWLVFLTKSFLELAGALATSAWFVRQRCASWGGAEGGGGEKLSSVNLSGACACPRRRTGLRVMIPNVSFVLVSLKGFVYLRLHAPPDAVHQPQRLLLQPLPP